MGNTVHLDGEWLDRSGKHWKSTQRGNTFQWIQDGSGKVATGIAVPLNGGSQWVIFATFDGQTHCKLIPFFDGAQLNSPVEIFTKASNNPIAQPAENIITSIPSLSGVMFRDYCGMIWSCSSHEGGHFVLNNLTDGRTCDSYVVYDANKSSFILYMATQRFGNETIARAETNDLSIIQLSNGDYLRRVGSTQSLTFTNQHVPIPQPIPQPIQQPQLPVQQTKYYRIGGGKDGISTWSRFNGVPCNTSVEGWEMVFEVDSNGNVSGGNRNDIKNSITKNYSGTFRNNIFNVDVKWTDGRVASYKGTANGNKVRLDFLVTAVGNQKGMVNDYGVNTGTLFETTAPPYQPKTYTINGKTYWRIYNGTPSNSIVDGWTMSCTVDYYGNVSGSNYTFGQTKTYSGSLINNIMDVTATWEDGRAATYKGTITNSTIKIDFIITAVGTKGGSPGDSGFNTGIVSIT